MAEVEYKGIKVGGSKLLLIVPLLGTIIGGLWGGFEVYQRYLSMEERINSFVSPDLSGFDKSLAVLTEQMSLITKEVQLYTDEIDIIKTSAEETASYARDVKNGLRDDINRIETRNRSGMNSSSESGHLTKKPKTGFTNTLGAQEAASSRSLSLHNTSQQAFSSTADAPAFLVDNKVTQRNAAGLPVAPYKFRPTLVDEASPDEPSPPQPAKKRRITFSGSTMEVKDAMKYSEDEQVPSEDGQVPASNHDITLPLLASRLIPVVAAAGSPLQSPLILLPANHLPDNFAL